MISEQNDEVSKSSTGRFETTDDDSSNAACYIIVFIRVNSCVFVAKKNPGYKTGIQELSGRIIYPSPPPSPSVFLSDLSRLGGSIGRLALLLR